MQLFYEEVNVGSTIPPLIKRPTTRQLVMWAGAADSFAEIHYDKDHAISVGLKGVNVPGGLIVSFIAQMLTDWIGEQGSLRRLEVFFRGQLYPAEDAVCKGTVLRCFEDQGQHLVECRVWAENGAGQEAAGGKAVVSLPVKSKQATSQTEQNSKRR